MSKIPPDDILESLYTLRIRESAQLKTVLEFYDMEIHQKISVLNHQTFFQKNNGEEEKRSEITIMKNLTPGTGELNLEQWSRIERE